MPAPANEYDTFLTVIIRCRLIAQHLGQQWTIITFDEALYSKATELLWVKPEESNGIILRLGGFHSSVAYLAAVGKDFSGSSLEDCWVESGIYSENTGDNVVKVKPYNHSIQAHKLTFEVLWRVLIGEFINWMSTSGRDIDKDFIDDVSCELVKAFESDDRHAGRRAVEAMKAYIPTIANLLQDFITEHFHEHTFQYWIN